MGVIADKIKDNKLFFKFILIAEISYLSIFTLMILPYEYKNSSELRDLFILFFIFMCLNHVIFILTGFFYSRFKDIKKEIALFFLFRICLIFFTIFFFTTGPK